LQRKRRQFSKPRKKGTWSVDVLITASAEWSYSAEAFAKGGDRDEHCGYFYPSPLFIIVFLAID
jgi:hypothetical protein